MPRVTINGQDHEVQEGVSLLKAIRGLGIDVPTLCHWEGVEPMNSCMLCVVRETNRGQLLPSCSTMVQEGMCIETDCEEVSTARKEVLELIVSEHMGDCEAPCSHTCPASLNIPVMMRQIYAGEFDEAAYTVTHGLVFPWTLGYVCPAPCQNPCRRKSYDTTMEIKLLHRTIAQKALKENPELLECPPDTGKRIAIVGAGLAGMAAAWVLRKEGHACTVYEKESRAGGRVRDLSADELPPEVLDAEVEWLAKLGVQFEYNREIAALDELDPGFDAVILGCKGAGKPGGKVFEAKEHKLAVRCVGNGKTTAQWVGRYLRSMDAANGRTLFESKTRKLEKHELEHQREYNENQEAMTVAIIEGDLEEAQKEAGRCLHCDCRKRVSCGLRKFATEYGVEKKKYKTTENPSWRIIGGGGSVIFEPGKCIRCGLCVAIAAKHGEEIGLALHGRGFDVEITVPFGKSLEEALEKSADECVAACPTAAISFVNKEDIERCHTTTWIEV